MTLEYLAEKARIENEMPWQDRQPYRTVYDLLSARNRENGSDPALTFQITSGPGDKALSLSYGELFEQVTRAANAFRSLGVQETDTVALVMPNCNETVVTLLGGMVAGIAMPLNPLLEPEQISALLRESNAKVVVTLRAFPKTDIAQKVAEAVGHAPSVKAVVEVDLLPYLSPPKSWIVPMIRPKVHAHHHARVLPYRKLMAAQNGDRLDFADAQQDRIASYFHTGGTTGMPKIAQHTYSGIIYQGWCLGREVADNSNGVLLCALPMFHVFGAHLVLQISLMEGGHMIMPTPQGFRGDGVFDNFWKLVEHHKPGIMCMVPTAAAMLLQRPVNADVSSLSYAITASAPMPVEVFHQFERETGLTIVEGYGMTEATAFISRNPTEGEKKPGSVGLSTPYAHTKLLKFDANGAVSGEAGPGEVGEIVVTTPGVVTGQTYLQQDKNVGLFTEDGFMRTGDLGRYDEDGYLWITGRAKDVIIRGGHNIDPAEIEEAILAHPAVALAAAIGQPDIKAGEVPCLYVELVDGKQTDFKELMAFASEHIGERAALPKWIEIVPEMPLTNVGKIFKPALRKMAIARVFDQELAKGQIPTKVRTVIEDKNRGLVAVIDPRDGLTDDEIQTRIGQFIPHWQWPE